MILSELLRILQTSALPKEKMYGQENLIHELCLIQRTEHCIAAKFLIAALSGPASCRTGPIRQLAGSDRSEHNLSRSDGQTSCLVSDRP